MWVTKILKVGGIQAIGNDLWNGINSKSIQDFWSWEPIRNSGEAISNQFGVLICLQVHQNY
jgi:hypothetical protein